MRSFIWNTIDDLLIKTWFKLSLQFWAPRFWPTSRHILGYKDGRLTVNSTSPDRGDQYWRCSLYPEILHWFVWEAGLLMGERTELSRTDKIVRVPLFISLRKAFITDWVGKLNFATIGFSVFSCSLLTPREVFFCWTLDSLFFDDFYLNFVNCMPTKSQQA